MSASGNHKTEQGRPVFSILFLNSLIHATAHPLHSGSFRGGFNLHSGPAIRFLPINFLSPTCPFSYSIKLARMRIWFLLFVF